MSKITNPVVLIHKRENSDTYAVAITSGSTDYQDTILMASMEPDMIGDDIDTEQDRLLHGRRDRAIAPAAYRATEHRGIIATSGVTNW